MDSRIVRLERIEINNFKNVKFGTVDLTNQRKQYSASILGLYGQNGSGKTALIDSLSLLKLLLSGKPIPVYFADFVNVDAEFSKLKYTFKVFDTEQTYNYKVEYEVCIKKSIDDSYQNISISDEKTPSKTIVYDEVLSYSYCDDKTKKKLSPIVNTTVENLFLPEKTFKVLAGNMAKSKAEILSYKKLTESTSRSFIFSSEFINIIRHNCTIDYHLNLFESLIYYGNFELFIINTANSGLITLNTMPLVFKYASKEKSTTGRILLNLDKPTLILPEDITLVESLISSMNIVLQQIVPGLTISSKIVGTELLENGSNASKIQLVSHKNSKEIPLSYESDGIKKIISILQLLIVLYNNQSITVAIDEIDSGVFEYLLGEILRIISEKGKGQLIFTSHNLRPLETIDRGFIAFTTTNPYKRYIRMTNVKTNNNLRDFYYRDIVLGEQSEEVYEPTNNYEISLAFREAGRTNGS